MIRPIPLQRYLQVMAARDIAASRVLAGSGLTEAQLEDQQALVDMAGYHRVVENIVRLAPEEGIGLEMGLARELADFRILGYAAQACHTIRQSVEEFWGRYGDALGMMSKLSVCDQSAKRVTIELLAVDLSEPTYRFFAEESWLLLLKLGSRVSGVGAQFEGMTFTYPEPAYGARYREIFNCPIKFNAGRTAAVISRQWFEQPLATTDTELCQLYRSNLDQLMRQIDASCTLRGRLYEQLIKQGRRIPALEDVARQFGMSPRTLRRQLQEEGSSYRKVVEEFRMETSFDCLRTERLSAKQLSDRLGFADVNAFRRAFKKWTGHTLREWAVEVLNESRPMS